MIPYLLRANFELLSAHVRVAETARAYYILSGRRWRAAAAAAVAELATWYVRVWKVNGVSSPPVWRMLHVRARDTLSENAHGFILETVFGGCARSILIARDVYAFLSSSRVCDKSVNKAPPSNYTHMFINIIYEQSCSGLGLRSFCKQIQ